MAVSFGHPSPDHEDGAGCVANDFGCHTAQHEVCHATPTTRCHHDHVRLDVPSDFHQLRKGITYGDVNMARAVLRQKPCCPVFEQGGSLFGGAVDHDGEGTILTTRQTLLNPNRNGWTKEQAEAALRKAFGAKAIVWIDEGLKNDHTDGHIDNIARFVSPGVAGCMEPSGGGDPNAAALKEIVRDLSSMRDAKGRRLEVFTVPSPGVVTDPEGELMAASYVNFYVANTTVTVPVYGAPNDEPALARIERLFPGRRVVGVPARELLLGGGAFHCISQQQPSGGTRG